MVPSLEKIILSIYDAALEPETWATLLADISDLTGGTSLYLNHARRDDPTRGQTWTHGFDLDLLAHYKAHYANTDNPGIRSVLQSLPGTVRDRREIADDRTFLRDPGHRAFLGEQGLFHGLIASVYRDAESYSALLCMRPERKGPIEGRQRAILNALVPHFGRAIAIRQKIVALSSEVGAMSGALQSLQTGVVTLGANLGISFANEEAQRVIFGADGISCVRGRLTLSDHAQQMRLASAVAAAATGGAGTGQHVFVQRPSGAADYALQVVQGKAGTALLSGRAPAATVFITDPAQSGRLPPAELLAERFCLTPTEAEVALLIASGQGTGHAARTLRMSLNTARTHLKSIYSKAGVRQQAELTRLILETFPPIRSCAEASGDRPAHADLSAPRPRSPQP